MWAWADAVIRQLKQKFETYAESYRAQAEQALGSKVFAEGEREQVEEDLARLNSLAMDRELFAMDSNRGAVSTSEKSE
jgi:pantothenate kinase-related protein Tda10